MALSNGTGMTQRELNCIINVVWEIVKWIAPLLEVEEEIDSDLENFYTPPKSPSKPLSHATKEQMKADTNIKHFQTLLDNHGWIINQFTLGERCFPKAR
jgi:hypothetical protein